MLQFFSSAVITAYNRLVGTAKALGLNPSLIGENGKPAKPAVPKK